MEKTNKQPKLRRLRNIDSGNTTTIAKPQTAKIISIRIDTKRDPEDLLERNMDIFVEELAKKILKEIEANPNFARIETYHEGGYKKTYLSVKLLSNEHKYLPKITVSKQETNETIR